MEDFGKVVLRVSLGVIMLLHGIFKIRHGVSFLTPLVQGIGLPPWFAYGSYLGEVVGPVLLILGLGARIGAFLVFANMVFAIVLVHRPDFFSLTKQGGWTLELQGMFLFTAFALMFLNPGRYAMSRRF
jgi:putative oxidoreductase